MLTRDGWEVTPWSESDEQALAEGLATDRMQNWIAQFVTACESAGTTDDRP